MTEVRLDADDLARLIERVFGRRPNDRAMAFLVDLPDERLADHPAWAVRRSMTVEWSAGLNRIRESLGLERVDLVHYRNVRRNNADLPDRAFVHGAGDPPEYAGQLSGKAGRHFSEIFDHYQILVAMTELSATAPLKLHAARHGFRAATMPGFGPAMIPALRLNYEEIHRRCLDLKVRLDRAEAARIRFSTGERESELLLDLRHRKATASGGLIREPGTAGNLPSGETYIVPYEGEIAGDASRSRGTMPLELEGELMFLHVDDNRVRQVEGNGPQAERERREIGDEPAYANLAELGLGLLAGYGIRPIGELLLDEKLGLHIALGRSDHFGGNVGAADFSAPDRVVHIDRVYLPEIQPQVRVLSVDLEDSQGTISPLMRDGDYVE